MTINARGEDDVEPESIMGKVAKASGANFNFRKETQKYSDVPSGPVVRTHTHSRTHTRIHTHTRRVMCCCVSGVGVPED